MTQVAVVAHRGKTLGDGLGALREVLTRAGIVDPLWEEVDKSRKMPKRVRKLLEAGADLIFVWGGDGSVQRVIDTVAGKPRHPRDPARGHREPPGDEPGIPADLEEAVRIGLYGADRTLDVGRMNGEHFAVMAGAGLDAAMIAEADGGLKDRLGRLAYILTGAKALSDLDATETKIELDGETWFEGEATCVLLGNVGRAIGGLEFFPHAVPDDGLLDIGVVTADGVASWSRTLARAATGAVDRSPFVQMGAGHRFKIRFGAKLPYELDGGDRDEADSLKVKVEPGAITVRVRPKAASA